MVQLCLLTLDLTVFLHLELYWYWSLFLLINPQVDPLNVQPSCNSVVAVAGEYIMPAKGVN